PQHQNIPFRARFDSTLAAIQSARSRAVLNNPLRRSTRGVQARAGDRASVPQACLGGSPFGNSSNTVGRGREQIGVAQAERWCWTIPAAHSCAIQQFYETTSWGRRLILSRSARITPGPNAATLRTIMMSAKRYIPIVSPIPAFTSQIQISQIFRILLFQMKNGYPISRKQMNTPAAGNRYFHLMSISGSTTLKGGRMRERHMFEPSHHPLPRHFVRPLKK